jgi:hypothetical protein
MHHRYIKNYKKVTKVSDFIWVAKTYVLQKSQQKIDNFKFIWIDIVKLTGLKVTI